MKKNYLFILDIIFVILSVIVIIYCFGFILDYLVIVKYTIDDGFSNTEIIISKEDRKEEIELFINYSKWVIIYAFFIISLLIYNMLKIKK